MRGPPCRGWPSPREPPAMTILSVSSGLSPQLVAQPQRPERTTDAAAAKSQEGSFGARIGDAINKVADAQDAASKAAQDFEVGKETDLASVMIEQQVASLGFQMTLQVRNKALSAYREIMNMPV